MEAAAKPWPALGVLLLRDGLVDQDELEELLGEQRDTRQHRLSGWKLGEILVRYLEQPDPAPGRSELTARADQPANIKSASKSVISALVGIAVDRKLLSLDDPIDHGVDAGTLLVVGRDPVEIHRGQRLGGDVVRQRTTATPAKTSSAAIAIRMSNGSPSSITPRATAMIGLM